MGIPNQEARLSELETLLKAFANKEIGIEEVLAVWWIRKRPDEVPCQRCVMLKCAFRKDPNET